MKVILLLGAGRSSSALVGYLKEACKTFDWKLKIADISNDKLIETVKTCSFVETVQLDILDFRKRSKLFKKCDIVINHLPENCLPAVLESCIQLGKPMVSPHQLTRKLAKFKESAIDNQVLALFECGAFPGLDHITAKQAIDRIQKLGGDINSFESFAGNLVNTRTKVSHWNPRPAKEAKYVVHAGKGTTRYLENGQIRHIPYHRVFEHARPVNIDQLGQLEAYPQSDALYYQKIYNLDKPQTLFKGTLRTEGFSKAWQEIVRLGLTENTYPVSNSESLTYRDFTRSFLHPRENEDEVERFTEKLDDDVKAKLIDLGLFKEQPIGLKKASPAHILTRTLQKQWSPDFPDRDVLIIHHEFKYAMRGQQRKLKATFIEEGNNATDSALHRVGGLTIGVIAKQILLGKVNKTGIHIPVDQQIYDPVINELSQLGIAFQVNDEVIIEEDPSMVAE
ncbi:MAG: saccharopine dehydrogenase C-terminal domain-containing protein [Bacteroidota bacterium]